MERFFIALRKLKNKQGVTLVELIMVMAIMAILGVAVMTLTTSSLGMYNKGRDLITKEEVAKIIVDYINQSMSRAKTITLGADGGFKYGAGFNSGKQVFIKGNSKIFGADAVSEKAIYGKYSVYVLYKVEKSSGSDEYDTFSYTVYVFDDGTNYQNGYKQQNYPVLLNKPTITLAASVGAAGAAVTNAKVVYTLP